MNCPYNTLFTDSIRSYLTITWGQSRRAQMGNRGMERRRVVEGEGRCSSAFRSTLLAVERILQAQLTQRHFGFIYLLR
jgi:hypothetical protein